LLIGTLLVVFAVVGGIVVIGNTLPLMDNGGTSEVAEVTTPRVASLEPIASASASQPAASATPAGNSLTITGALTILSAGTDLMAEASDDLSNPGSRRETAWTPVKAELDALLARRDSGDLSQDEFLDAYEEIGCVGSGGFSDFAPGRSVDIRDEGGAVIASGALQVGSSIGLTGCRLPFTIVGLPPAPAYTIAVGGATLRYTREQLESLDWNIELEFGVKD
jgi:hypothetical protein